MQTTQAKTGGRGGDPRLPTRRQPYQQETSMLHALRAANQRGEVDWTSEENQPLLRALMKWISPEDAPQAA